MSTALSLTLSEQMEYQKYSLDTVIIEVQKLLEKSSQGKGRDFYETIEQTLIALEFAMTEAKQMRRSYDKLCRRIEVMEMLLLASLKPLPSHSPESIPLSLGQIVRPDA